MSGAWSRFPGHAYPGRPPGEGAAAAADLALLHFVGPPAAQAARELAERLAEVCPKPPPAAVFEPDHQSLLALVRPVLLAELAADRNAGRLPGGTPEERFASFAAGLRDPARARAVLHGHPGLADRLDRHFSAWVDTRAEFAARLAADLDELGERLALDVAGPHEVERAEFGAGDPHRGGRTVALVTFRGGGRVVYKPRGLAVEAHFGALLGWINERGLRHRLWQPTVLDRGSHGWSAYVAPEPCRDRRELDRFCWRQGAFLALFHTLCGYDLHFENVLAAGEHPAFVDLEALFHTEPLTSAEDDSDVVTRSLRETVLAVGLLPQWLVEIDETGVRAQDQSGLTGGPGDDGLELRPALECADPGTDTMRLELRRPPARRTHNSPLPHGDRALAPALRDQLTAGFAEMYRLLLSHRAELLAPHGPLERFAHDEVRVVLRDTHQYKRLLQETCRPGALAAGPGGERVLDELAGPPEVVASERRQIERGDIPLFFTTPGTTALLDDSGTVLERFAERSGLDAVRSRLRGLSHRDLRHQLWYVQAALAAREPGARHGRRPVRTAPAGRPRQITPELAADAARRIGDELLDTVLRDERTGVVEWPSLELVGGAYWRVGPSGFGLYAGVSGIALFLAELGAFCGDRRYRSAAETVLEALVDPDDMPDADDLAGLSVGGYEELGGLVYALARLGALWEEQALFDAAEHLVPAIRRGSAESECRHVVGGTAGAVLALARLYRANPRPATLAALADVARALPTGAADALGAGFGHGAAGVAYALGTAFELTGDDGYRTAAERVWRQAYARADDGSVAWCGGASGTALAAAATGRRLPAALAATRAALAYDPDDDSLCHGRLGLAEALLACGRLTGDEELLAGARATAGAVALAVLTGRARTGVPGGVPTPGLMAGSSGIGYGLLRLAAPERVPNLLLLGG
ncbi:type 2 lanthipeptide synthetase LanM family protein [Streptomyces sp. NPDC051243]|uniref:type 2 lanthipeptide synthetase LanM family protein n=1 Tax=Streptomyces sp. NPDC051243 TaxID=3365646 RepID=UPI00378AFD6C